jgi:hypothetical protein
MMQAQTDIGDIDAGAAVPDTDTPPKPRTIEITFVTNGEKTVNAPENSNLLRVSLREQGGIPFKCGGGSAAPASAASNAGWNTPTRSSRKSASISATTICALAIAWLARPS